MRNKRLFGLMICLVFAAVFFIMYRPDMPSVSKELYEYYTSNYIDDTNAGNAVAAIYLNYRFFDTLFETLTLMISVIGVIYFSRHSQEDIY